MRKIDLDKFICSLAKQHGEMPKVWEKALAEQGLAYNCFTNSLHPIMPYTEDVSPYHKIGDYVIKKTKSGTYQSVVTNFNSAEKEISEPIISYQGSENAWKSATDFIPTDKQRCLCYDKNLNGIYCYIYVKETNAWYYQSNPERKDLTFLCGYDCKRVPFWMIMPKILSFITKSDSENDTDDVVLVPHQFFTGEWITNGKRILRIGSICEEESLYYFDEKNFGSSYDTIENVDANYHLWSIDDAKKDDILSNSGRDKIIIKFESKVDLPLLTIVKSNAHALFGINDENVKVYSSTEKKTWHYYPENPLSYKCYFWKPATSEEKKTFENALSSISQVTKKE